MRVHLISYTKEYKDILWYCWNIINNPGFPDKSFKPSDSSEDMHKIIAEFLKSGLGGPLEMINFVFGFEGVTRAFTHQLVRTRLASYMQQSQRFTDFYDRRLPVKMPKSIFSNPATCDIWDHVISEIDKACCKFKELGIPTEDIRSIYPTNTMTNIIQAIDYNALRHMLSHRLCTQAQGEFQEVAADIKSIVTDIDPQLGQALQPACVITGICAFNTSLDRECPNRKDSLSG